MNAVIEDPMGLESGIRIDMVKTVTDRKAGRITIRGRMTACTKSPAVPDIEPEIECAIIDENEAIAEIALSRHNGCFWTNRQAIKRTHRRTYTNQRSEFAYVMMCGHLIDPHV